MSEHVHNSRERLLDLAARGSEQPSAEARIRDLEFTVMKLSEELAQRGHRLARLTAAAREVVAANLDILAGPGHYSPAKDARYEKAFAALADLLRKGGNE